MKQFLFYLLTIFLLAFSLINCESKDETLKSQEPSCASPSSDTSVAKILIIGEWDWVLTYKFLKGHNSPSIETPDREGRKKLIFGSDNLVQIIEKDFPADIEQYFIEKSEQDSSLHLHITNPVDLIEKVSLLKICTDSLILDYSYNDADGKEFYIKSK